MKFYKKAEKSGEQKKLFLKRLSAKRDTETDRQKKKKWVLSYLCCPSKGKTRHPKVQIKYPLSWRFATHPIIVKYAADESSFTSVRALPIKPPFQFWPIDSSLPGTISAKLCGNTHQCLFEGKTYKVSRYLQQITR